MKKELDAATQRYLGSDPSAIRTIPGQKADPQKVGAMQEKYLMADACRFGDILVRYVVAHHKLSFEQRVWGFTLALFCIRGDYPDGTEDFDVIADAGGYDLTLSDKNKNVITDEEQAAQFALELPVFDPSAQHNAAQFAEQVTRYIEMKKQQQGVSNTQAAYGLGRAFHNLRLEYPRDKGGTAVFDELARRAHSYYVQHREKDETK